MYLLIKLMNGETIEQSVDKDVVVIGRSVRCDVVIPQDGMSRQHCQIDVIDGEIFITDLGSTNGVQIDGQKIEPHLKTPYQTYLTLSFGAIQSLQIEIESPQSFNRDAAAIHASAAAGDLANATQTRTRKMRQEDKTPVPNANTPFKPKVHAATTKTQTIFVNTMVVLILAAAVWWYMSKDETTNDHVDEIPAEPVEKQKTYDTF